MMPPTSIDGTDITGATIDGQDVQEITVDGQTVFTAGPPIVDDFEDGNLTKYNRSEGNTANFAADSSSPVKNGSNSLKATNGDSGNIFSTNGSLTYPVQDDEYRVFVRFNNSSLNPRIFFFVEDASTPDLYEVILRDTAGDLLLRKRINGSFSDINNGSFNPSSGEWYEISITPKSGGTIDVELFDDTGTSQVSFTGSDSSLTSGGIGFGSTGISLGSSDEWYFDFARIV